MEKLKEIKELGVTSFVDPCPMELGRDPEFAAECADKSGLNIVVATGLYNEALAFRPISGVCPQTISPKSIFGKSPTGSIKRASKPVLLKRRLAVFRA